MEKREKCLLWGCTHCVCINEMCLRVCSIPFSSVQAFVCNVCVQVYNLVLMFGPFFLYSMIEYFNHECNKIHVGIAISQTQIANKNGYVL